MKSAEQDFNLAQQNLGVLYALGKGVPQDHEKAIKYLQKGTGKDSIACQVFLAQVLSTFPRDEYGLRDGHIATKIAENLVQSRRSTEHLSTLASAYAEAERFEDSITIQKELLSNLKQKKSLSRNLLSIHEDYLERYQSKKPLRDHSLSFGLEYDVS